MATTRTPRAKAAPAADDTKLFALCDRFEALEEEANAAWKALPEEQAEQIGDEVIAQQNQLAGEICGLVAHTPAGILRKLRAVAVCAPHLTRADDISNTDDLLIASALQDALGTPAPRPTPELFRSARARRDEATKLCLEALRLRKNAEDAQIRADLLTRRILSLRVL